MMNERQDEEMVGKDNNDVQLDGIRRNTNKQRVRATTSSSIRHAILNYLAKSMGTRVAYWFLFHSIKLSRCNFQKN
jgi:hypothetical protein